MTKKVVIIGAGPSGLLLAHYLLKRGDRYRVEIYERLSDPRTLPFARTRTHPVTLNERGLRALRAVDGLVEKVRQVGEDVNGIVFHKGRGQYREATRKSLLVTLDRTQLTMVLLDSLTNLYGESRVNIFFNCECKQVDIENKALRFLPSSEKPFTLIRHEFTVYYDFLVGADGSRSTVRSHLLGIDLFECDQKYIAADYKPLNITVPEEALNESLAADKIHYWLHRQNTLLTLQHQRDTQSVKPDTYRTMSGVILFPRQYSQIATFTNVSEVLSFFRKNFPEVGKYMTDQEAETFLLRSPARIMTIRCNRYHYEDSVLLVGDAAHAVSSSISQGCNAALDDIFVFNNLLSRYADNLKVALFQYSSIRTQEAHALINLSDYAFMRDRNLLFEFMGREFIVKTLHNLFPWAFPPSLVDLLFDTTVPYSEIWSKYKNWLNRAKG